MPKPKVLRNIRRNVWFMIRRQMNGDLVGVTRCGSEEYFMYREWGRILWMVGLQRISSWLF